MEALGHYAHNLFLIVRQIKFTIARTSQNNLDSQIV